MVLKPCPFCGGEAEIERAGDFRKSTIYACAQCGCRLETGETRDHGTQWDARWVPPIKTRPATNARIAQLENGLRRALRVIDGPYQDRAGMRPQNHPAVDDLRALLSET